MSSGTSDDSVDMMSSMDEDPGESSIIDEQISMFASARDDNSEGLFSSTLFEAPTNVAQDYSPPISIQLGTEQLDNMQQKLNKDMCDKLLKAVCKMLAEASSLEYGKQRTEKVLFLFDSLIFPIEPDCIVKLYGSVELAGASQRYYEVIAQRFGEIKLANSDIREVRTIKKDLIHFFPSLRSNPHFPQLFALLFHQWIFFSELPNSELAKQMGVFLTGVNRLFWMDLETGRQFFKPVYHFLTNEVLLNAEFWSPDREFFRHLNSLFCVLSKFLFYYKGSEILSQFLTKVEANVVLVKEALRKKSDVDLSLEHSITNMLSTVETSQTQLEETLASQEITHTPLADIFIREATRTCNHIRNETVLVDYLKSFGVFRYSKLNGRSSALLFTTLQTFCNPGGPLYPPKTVRHAADEALCECFPHGNWVRTAIKIGFRLLHPIRVVQQFIIRLFALLLLVKSFFTMLFSPLKKMKEKKQYL